MSIMTNEEKAALEANEDSNQENSEVETSTEDANVDDDSSNDNAQNSENTNYYEAELKREREAREKAEQALAAKRFKNSEKRRSEEKDEQDDEEKPLTAAQLEVILARERESNQKEIQAARIQDIAKRLGKSEQEVNLIVEIHKNRDFPRHLTLEEQLEEAYVIANKKKLIGERNEALRALRGKDQVNSSGTSMHQDSPEVDPPKISSAEASAYKAAGMLWNGKTRRFEKKLNGGKLLIKDPKTKQTRMINAS